MKLLSCFNRVLLPFLSITPPSVFFLLNPFNSPKQVGNKSSWVLRRWKVSQPSHALEIGPFDLFGCRLRHLRRGRPIILARQEVDGTYLAVDLIDAVAGVEAAEVEVEIAMEDTIRLTRI